MNVNHSLWQVLQWPHPVEGIVAFNTLRGDANGDDSLVGFDQFSAAAIFCG